jgi:ribose 5-phosphate isomerase B
MIKIAIGSDHGGYELKSKVITFLRDKKYEVKDMGTHSKDSCDYPMIGFEVAQVVSDGKADRGVLICKTGVGMAIIANKLRGIRAVACYDNEMAKSSREHNDCNIIVLAASYTNIGKAKEMLKIWLKTEAAGDRHGRRVKQIKEIEAKLK